MAISASNTQASQRAAQQALAEKKRKEEEEMRKRAERERKEKELEARLRLKHFEDEKRDRERKEREEKLNEEKERLREKKEAIARDKLLGNVKKPSRSRSPSSYPSVNSGSRDELRKRRLPSDDEGDGMAFLTREEKRERRRVADLNFGAGRSKRATFGAGASQKSRKILPGGGIDGDLGQNSAGAPVQSVKARLAAMPNTLQKLNVNKRDTRTIDEIVRDREKTKEGRVLNGEQAKEFNDWFGKRKDTTGLAKKTAALDLSANESRSVTPTSSNKPASGPTLNNKPSTASLPSFGKTKDSLKPSPSKVPSTSRPGPSSRPSSSGTARPRPSSAHVSSSAGKKHRRSESFSEDEEEYDSPPSKKRYAPPAQDDYRSEIWKMFGKDRSSYVNDMVDSDEDDMEADAMDLEREEMRRFVILNRLFYSRLLMGCVWLVHALLGRKTSRPSARRRCTSMRRGRRRWKGRRNVGELVWWGPSSQAPMLSPTSQDFSCCLARELDWFTGVWSGIMRTLWFLFCHCSFLALFICPMRPHQCDPPQSTLHKSHTSHENLLFVPHHLHTTCTTYHLPIVLLRIPFPSVAGLQYVVGSLCFLHTF
jgi:protein SPT2